MGKDIFASEGATSDEVTTYQNAPASPEPTPIFEVEAEQGTFLRFVNQVAKGAEKGIPIYADLRDENDDPLPVNTTLYLAVKPAGHNGKLIVSETLRSIEQYQTLTLTEQRNVDNIDAVKVILQAPESAKNGGNPVQKIDVRDIDAMFIMADSDAAIDWSNSSLFIESNAVEQHGRR